MSWTAKKAELQEIARKQHPSVILTTKDSWFWKAVGWLLQIVTFGVMNRAKFLTKFATTLGPVQAYPAEWKTVEVRTLVHESRHTAQASFFGWFVPVIGWVCTAKLRPWVGLPLMAVFYGLLLPVGFNWFRYRMELDADKASWKYMMEHEGWDLIAVHARAKRFAETVGSWNYGHPVWKSWAVWGFKRAANKLKGSRG